MVFEPIFFQDCAELPPPPPTPPFVNVDAPHIHQAPIL